MWSIRKTILWAPTFPCALTYPKTLEIIDRGFGKLAPAMKKRLTLRNAARVYNIALRPPSRISSHLCGPVKAARTTAHLRAQRGRALDGRARRGDNAYQRRLARTGRNRVRDDRDALLHPVKAQRRTELCEPGSFCRRLLKVFAYGISDEAGRSGVKVVRILMRAVTETASSNSIN